MKSTEKTSTGFVDPFSPEELEEVRGPTYASERPERKLENSARKARESTGLDFESFDDLRVEELSEDSIAQTRRKRYSNASRDYFVTVLAADPELLNLPRELRTHALTHENVHSRQFTGRLYETLVDHGIDGSEAERLQSMMEKDESRMEGATEIITHFLDPGSEKVGKRFYPDEMELVEQELGQDSELVKQIKEVKDQVLEDYREVYNFETEEGLYHEKGVFAGQEYEAMVIGEDAEIYGAQTVTEYLIEETYRDNEYQEFVESNDYGGDVLENTVVKDYLE